MSAGAVVGSSFSSYMVTFQPAALAASTAASLGTEADRLAWPAEITTTFLPAVGLRDVVSGIVLVPL
jgi:hypothetical protein